MTDNQDLFGLRPDDGGDTTVAELASRAIAVLALKRAHDRPLLSERLILQLVDAARSKGDAGVQGAITDILHSGIPAEEVLDYYIPEAARRLGDDWCEDGIGFAEVTIATARLQRVVRSLATAPQRNFSGVERCSVLVVVVDGEYHTLGALIMTEQFRRLGLSVRLLLGESNRKVLTTVADGHFDAIFFSVAVAEKLADLRELVEGSRRVAEHGTPIVVGGAIGQAGTDIRKLTGADIAANDPKEALRLCGLKISPPGAKRRAKME